MTDDTTTPPPVITAKNLVHRRNRMAILDNVSLTLGAGDFITIIGPNGAGKTTLLKILAGIMPPDSGSVTRANGATIGYIPQRIAAEASLPMTAGRFLDLGKTTSTNDESIISDTGIASILATPLSALSGGEWQRLLLARALLKSPDVLILDEPAQNLDATGQIAFYSLLEDIHKSRGLAILMVSHDLHMVMASTRRVICLYHHICCSGAPRAVARDPEFTRLFGEDMAQQMAVYRHRHDHDHA